MKAARRVLLHILFPILIAALTLIPIIPITAHSYHQKYEGYKIYDIFIENEKQYELLQQSLKNSMDVIGGAQRHSQSIRVLLSPDEILPVDEILRSNNWTYQVINDNVAESVRTERVLQRSVRSASNDIINFESYQRFDAISNYLEYLQAQYPQQVKLLELGKSYEGRHLKAIHITSGANETSTEKPLILIDAGIHSREWISHATALYVIQQLVENATFYRTELEMFDWLIWPVVNPDGYEYSHVHERLWRKSRQPAGNKTFASSCVGVDLNRNFDFYWAYVGSSSKPCDVAYHGPKAFSEPEAVALRDLLLNVNATCLMYLTLHSYGNYLLYPWGYQKKLPLTWRYLDAVAHAGANAIRKSTGTYYTVGSSTNVLYAASGASDDYAFGVAHIPLALCMELPSGGSGFDPPANRILPIARESWLGIRAMALEAYTNPSRNLANHSVTNLLLHLVSIVSMRLLV